MEVIRPIMNDYLSPLKIGITEGRCNIYNAFWRKMIGDIVISNDSL